MANQLNNLNGHTSVARRLSAGETAGDLLVSTAPLSFWGGVDLKDGTILDSGHPLRGRSMAGKVLALPCGRGSCTGSAAILELLYRGTGPAALILETIDSILTLGVAVASKVFDLGIPVLVLEESAFAALADVLTVHVGTDELYLMQKSGKELCIPIEEVRNEPLELSATDRAMLEGAKGPSTQLAMELMVEFARLQGASRLIDVSRAHIDASIYTGPGILLVAQKFAMSNARFLVRTTLNAISIDQQRWRQLNMAEASAHNAQALADAYLAMGAFSSFTCAPYSLSTQPSAGEQIGWSESNAVVYANSVLGARTQKYPDFLDICIALTGRAPFAGCHTDEGRTPTLRIHAAEFQDCELNWSLLGYVVGNIAGNRIPLVTGLDKSLPTPADLKNLCAAFGTTSSASMLQIVGITPDLVFAGVPLSLPVSFVTSQELADARRTLTTACDDTVQLISLGSPHLLLDEFTRLSLLCRDRQKHADVEVLITTNREIYQQVAEAGILAAIEVFGALVITDTCFCMLEEPVIGSNVKTIMTNSAKYAHYGPGLVKKGMHIGSLADCIQAACTGHVEAFA